MHPYLGMALLTFVFIKLSNIFFLKINNAPILYGGIAAFFALSFGNEARNTFIKTVFSKNNFQKIRIIENGLITLPFSFFLWYKTFALHAVLVLILSGVLSFFNSFKKINFVIPTPFYKHPFEFIIGFRRFFVVIFITYGLTVIAINVHNFNLGIFALCVLGILISEFYKKIEPKTFVWTHNLSSKEFLKHKVSTALKFSFCVCLPIHLGLWIAFPTQFYITLIFQIIAFCFLIACIFAKYKHYPKNTLITTYLTIGLCLWFPPLFFVVIPYLYKEALTNLHKIL